MTSSMQAPLSSTSLVFIDAAVDNLQSLINGVISGVEVVVLDPAQDGVQQIARTLSDRHTVESVHIVSHGAPGCLYLGNTELSLSTLQSYGSELQAWSTALADNGSILLYGCNVATGDAGEEFVEKLHQLTDRHIAASRTPTGNAALGGNWQLEVTTGSHAELAFSATTQEQYEGVLAILNSGGGVEWDTFNSENIQGGTGLAINRVTVAGVTPENEFAPIDSGLGLFVDDARFVGTTNDNSAPNQYDSGLVAIAGVQAQVKYYTDPDLPVFRSLLTFTNTGTTAVTKTIRLVTELGGGAGTSVVDSSGNNTVDAADRFVVLDDDSVTGGDAAITQVLYGPGNPTVKPTASALSGPNGVLETTYSLTLAAGETKSLLLFTAANATTAAAQGTTGLATIASDISALRSNNLLAELSATELRQVANWDFKGGVTVTPTTGLTTTEAGGTAQFSVVLTAQPSENITVNLTSSDTTEGTVPATVIFTPQNWNTAQTVTVTGVDDTADDGDQTYTIQTSIATSADPFYSGLTAADIADVTVSNTDNDPASGGGTTNPPGGGSNPNQGRRVVGTSGNDRLTGASGNDTIVGQNGNDRLFGRNGNDTLRGGRGRDRLDGGAGNDRLFGNEGADTMIGGAGRDIFVLTRRQGTDRIQDYRDGQDRIALQGVRFGSLEFEQRGRNTLVTNGRETLATLVGVRTSQLSSSDFTTV